MEKLADRVFVLGLAALTVAGVLYGNKPSPPASVKMEEVEKKAQEIADKKFNEMAGQLNTVFKEIQARMDKVDPPKAAKK